jgi:hypothetical protein
VIHPKIHLIFDGVVVGVVVGVVPDVVPDDLVVAGVLKAQLLAIIEIVKVMHDVDLPIDSSPCGCFPRRCPLLASYKLCQLSFLQL